MRAFVVTVPIDDVGLASDVLWQLGVRAIEEREASSDTARFVELWTAVGEESDAVDRAANRIGERWEWRTVEVVDDAAETWRDFAAPMWIDDGFVVVPAWQPHRFDAAIVAVTIEPGGAFGLGDHPTTALSLRALRRCFDDPGDRADRVEIDEVADIGCGTGVIAVAAAMLGARRVRAVDIAGSAVEATRDNAGRNGVSDRIEVDTTDASDLDGPYAVVVANILAPVLVDLAADLRRLTAADGSLVISGVLADRHDHVLAALEPMIVANTDVLDGWAAVTLRHR